MVKLVFDILLPEFNQLYLQCIMFTKQFKLLQIIYINVTWFSVADNSMTSVSGFVQTSYVMLQNHD